VIIIRPVAIPPAGLADSGAVLTVSNVPETDHAAYNAGTTYAAGDKVIVLAAEIRRIYESAAGGNVGNYPPTSPTHWIDLGYVNRWRMFDGGTFTQSSQATSITCTLEVDDFCNSLACFNVDAAEATIKVYSGADLIHERWVDMRIGSSGANWWEYFYGQVEYNDAMRDFVDLSIPGGHGHRIDLEFERTGGSVGVGLIVVGRQQQLGSTLYGSRIGLVDYSRKEVDDFGNFSVVQRKFSKRAELDILASTPDAARIQRAMIAIRATPTVFVGSAESDIGNTNPRFEETIVYGYYRDFDLLLETAGMATYTLEIEGL